MKKEIKNFDFAVAGNGMIGTLTAFLLKKNFPQKFENFYPKKNFFIFGRKHALHKRFLKRIMC